MNDSENKTDKSLVAWLGFNNPPEFLKAPRFGIFVGWITVLIFGTLVVLLLADLLVALATNTSESVRNYGILFAALVSAPFLIWRTHTLHRQADISEQGLITDRISKAVEQIGAEKVVHRQFGSNEGRPKYAEKPEKEQHIGLPVLSATQPRTKEIDFNQPIAETVTLPNLEVRIGGLYALERIAQDSPRDHIQIMEILCAYVRENAPALSLEPTEGNFDIAKPRADIQTVIDILGRRSQPRIDAEWKLAFRLNLNGTDLSGVNFSNGNFAAALFVYCRLEGAFFQGTFLSGARFYGSLLNFTRFTLADITGAKFDHAVLTKGNLSLSGPTGAKQKRGISLAGSNFSFVDFLGSPKVSNAFFMTKDTKFSDTVEFDSETHYTLESIYQIARINGSPKEIKDAEETLTATGFRFRSPFVSSDLSTAVEYYPDFLRAMNLQGFPYE